MKKPRKLTLVKFKFEGTGNLSGKYPFKKGKTYIFLGEIINMPGHCIVADYPSGYIFSGYHTDNFVELEPDEL